MAMLPLPPNNPSRLQINIYAGCELESPANTHRIIPVSSSENSADKQLNNIAICHSGSKAYVSPPKVTLHEGTK